MRNLLMQSPIAIAAAWIGIYLIIILSPLLILLLHPAPPGRGFWLEFSVALGFIGLAMMVLQFALTARIRAIEAAYGIDIILQFHRYTSIVAFVLILVHPTILFVTDPDTLQLLNFLEAPWRARAAVIATLALILLIVTAIWRQRLNIPYEPWRLWHGIFAATAVGLGLAHAFGVANYLSLFWKNMLWLLFGLVALWLLIFVRLVKPWQMSQHPYLVEQVVPERGDVWTLVLRPRGHAGLAFQSGQFAWLTLAISPFRMREHPFSIASSGDNLDCLEFGIKAVGDFTSGIKDVKPGTVAFLDGPYGVFTVERYWDAAGFVLIAGGIGITPIMSMLRTAADRQDDRSFLLIYASRSWEDITYREDLDGLTDKLDLTLVHVLREAPEDWSGETGYVDQDLLDRYIPNHRGSRHYFVCAVPKMMDQVERALHMLHVPVTHVHMEHYNLV